jgi:solute carrier family 25 phosphate transporter 23/24/25/41
MGAQLSHPSILKQARGIFRDGGMTAFWKGNGVTIVHWLPYLSINFFAYEQYKMV